MVFILKNKKIIIFLVLLFIGALCLTRLAYSQTIFKPQVGVGNIAAGESQEITGATFAEYIINFYKWGVRAIATLAVVMIIIAGFKWMTAIGNASAIAQAKGQMTDAIIGLFLALGANLLLGFFNPALTRFKSLDITTIEKKELTEWDFPLPLNKAEWYHPDREPYAGARGCGNSKFYQEEKIVRYGTECEVNNHICDLKFSITEQDYLDWKEGKTDKDISLLVTLDRNSSGCIRVKGTIEGCDPPIVAGCAQISLANEDGTDLKKYPLSPLKGLAGYEDYSCGARVQDTFFIFGKTSQRWDTRCGDETAKGCTFTTMKQIYKDGTTHYVSNSFCNFYPGKSCPLNMARSACSSCGSPSNCTDGFQGDKKICCCESLYPPQSCSLK